MGRWEIVNPLGEGGQAHTFLVRDAEGADTTLRVLKRLKNNKRLERFKTEIELLKTLDHPNVLKILDYDTESEKAYYVSDYYPDGDLEHHQHIFSEDIDLTLKVFLRICLGVEAAHKAGVVHRDLKPENILFTADDFHPVVADFGIAYVEDGERQTLTLEAVGPRFYMAPELEDGRQEDVRPRSDLYSLGKILYWMLSGGKRFAREQHHKSEYQISKFLAPPVVPHLLPILDKLIVAEPNSRFENIDILIDRVRTAQYAIRGNFNHPSIDAEKFCRNCGGSTLTRVGRGDPTSVRNFGFTPVGDPDWRIYICSACSAIQIFRPDIKNRSHM